MSNSLQSAENFYSNVTEFNTIDTFLSETKIEDTNDNSVKGIIGLFIGKEKQLEEYINTKLESANFDDRMQLGLLKAALHEYKNNQLKTQSNLNELRGNITSNIENLNGIDFRIQKVTAIIKQGFSSKKEYVLNQRYAPIINKIGENSYEMILILQRNSQSSMRGDQKVTLSFIYDGHRIIFYNDQNKNGHIDGHESTQYKDISHKIETKIDKRLGIVYDRGNTQTIKLDKKSITQNGIKSLELELEFQK